MADTKICKCICCGTDVEVTKFATPSVVKCEDCKSSGVSPNPEILEQIKSGNKPKASAPTITGDKKESICTVCGSPTMIGKFASHKTALCDNCKGGPVPSGGNNGEFKIDLNRIDRSTLPNIEEMYVVPGVIGNERLRKVSCPACERPNMKIVKILDYSERGIVATYQCQHCKLIMNLSEQARHMMIPSAQFVMFSYTGEQIRGLISPLDQSRIENSVHMLVDLLDKHNIPIDGIPVPPFITNRGKKEYIKEHAEEVEEVKNRILENVIKDDVIEELQAKIEKLENQIRSTNNK